MGGRLFQVEYAIEAIKLGSTAIGIQTGEGVILAVEKRITSPLMEPTSIEKIVEIDSHIAYDEKMQVESVAQAVSNLAIAFGNSDDDIGVMSRPFGVAILFAGMDENGPQLFHMDPSGTYLQFDAKAIGSGSEGAQQSLQEAYHKSITLKEATKTAFTILKQVMEEKLNETNVEAARVTTEGFQLIKGDELEGIIKELDA